MDDAILIGSGSEIVPAPEGALSEGVAGARAFFGERLAFMTREHHLVRNFAVVELPRRRGKPLRPEDFSRSLGLAAGRVGEVLDDLERNLFFLVRDAAGAVCWAFPVTVEQTPHRARFESGEAAFAA